MEPITVLEPTVLPDLSHANAERFVPATSTRLQAKPEKPQRTRQPVRAQPTVMPPERNGDEDPWSILETLEVEQLLWPDHTQLPDKDDSIVNNFQEHPQASLLSNTILPILRRLYPDEKFAIGQDSGIYWGLPDRAELIELNRELMAKKRKSSFPRKTTTAKVTSPDWYFVPGVPPLLKGNKVRRSYVMWKEFIPPVIAIEFVSGDGSEERDNSPITGKFWSYEQVIRPAYYAIYEVEKAQVEVYRLVEDHFELTPANQRGHYPIDILGVELGIWQGKYEHVTLPWLRWWDVDGNLLLTGDERAEQEQQRAEQERQRAEQERQRAEQEYQLRLAAEVEIARLRALLAVKEPPSV